MRAMTKGNDVGLVILGGVVSGITIILGVLLGEWFVHARERANRRDLLITEIRAALPVFREMAGRRHPRGVSGLSRREGGQNRGTPDLWYASRPHCDCSMAALGTPRTIPKWNACGSPPWSSLG